MAAESETLLQGMPGREDCDSPEEVTQRRSGIMETREVGKKGGILRTAPQFPFSVLCLYSLVSVR